MPDPLADAVARFANGRKKERESAVANYKITTGLAMVLNGLSTRAVHRWPERKGQVIVGPPGGLGADPRRRQGGPAAMTLALKPTIRQA